MNKKLRDALFIIVIILLAVSFFIFIYFEDRIWILTKLASIMLIIAFMLALWAQYFSDIEPLWLSFSMGLITFAFTIVSLYLLYKFDFQQPQSTMMGVAFAALTARVLNKNVARIKKKFSID